MSENAHSADYMIEMVVDLINDAFILSDEGLFTPRHPGRTKKAEITQLIKEDKLILAFTTPVKDIKLTNPVGSVMIDVNYDKKEL